MSFSRTFTIVLRQFYLIRGSFSRVFPLFAWAAVDMVLWGFLTRYLNTVASAGFNFVPALLGAGSQGRFGDGGVRARPELFLEGLLHAPVLAGMEGEDGHAPAGVQTCGQAAQEGFEGGKLVVHRDPHGLKDAAGGQFQLFNSRPRQSGADGRRRAQP